MKKGITISLLTLLIFDLFFSFFQFFNTPLDGDMAGGIVLSSELESILNDPFGINAVYKGAAHPNPNRYFSHKLFYEYFRKVPAFLQHFVNPITSVYLACALIKLIFHGLFIWVFVKLVTNGKEKSIRIILALSILVSALLQTYGFNSQMGVIDKSITYFFFYGMPLILSLFYIVPYARISIKTEDPTFSHFEIVQLLVLTVILPFTGPLVPGYLLVLIFTGFCYCVFTKTNPFRTNKIAFLLLLLLAIICLYSLYAGSLSTLYFANKLTLFDRYLVLPEGVLKAFTQKICFPLLILLSITNVQLLKHYFLDTSRKLLNVSNLLLIFSFLYIVLLPLGGYRPYRPEILRFDTVMPITAGLIFIYVYSLYLLFSQVKGKYSKLVVIQFVLVILIFSNADKNGLGTNSCERNQLIIMQGSKAKVIKVDAKCKLLSWGIHSTKKQEFLNSKLLQIWNVLQEDQEYTLEEVK